jgi:hypothetical protein
MAAQSRRVLVIDAEAQRMITAAVDRARARPVPILISMQLAHIGHDRPVLELHERKPNAVERPQPECIALYDGYQCAISFEEQPAGMLRHLSVAVNNPGKVPMPSAMEMISKAFGFTDFPPINGKVWVEEFRSGEYAVNVIELIAAPKPATEQ